MKIKSVIIFVICIGLIIIIPNWLISLYSNSGTGSPKTYSTIEDFEKETGILVYNFYDLEEFVTYDRKTHLKTSPNHVTINLMSNNKDEKNYSIENLKNGLHRYQVYNKLFKENTKDMKKEIMENGILYQYHGYEEAYQARCFTGFFVKENFYYQIGFTNNDLSISEVEQKMINYVKLVEDIN